MLSLLTKMQEFMHNHPVFLSEEWCSSTIVFGGSFGQALRNDSHFIIALMFWSLVLLKVLESSLPSNLWAEISEEASKSSGSTLRSTWHLNLSRISEKLQVIKASRNFFLQSQSRKCWEHCSNLGAYRWVTWTRPNFDKKSCSLPR